MNTGNTTYKAVQRTANVLAVGPMLQGLRRPVNDLSRGALVDDIVYTIALTAIQADTQASKNGKPKPSLAAASLHSKKRDGADCVHKKTKSLAGDLVVSTSLNGAKLPHLKPCAKADRQTTQ